MAAPSGAEPASGAAAAQAAERYEQAHVHGVYEAIAPHFAATRQRAWPLVAAFLRAQPPGSVGVDVGCGNGKYLAVNPAVVLLGADRSAALAGLARGAGHAGSDVVVADSLALPVRAGAADFAICIAVVHHLASRLRRRRALAALLRCLRPGCDARALVYVWALEQASSRRGWQPGDAQDTLVPWVMRRPLAAAPAATFQRYYHLYREGELDDDVRAAGGVVVDGGYERDNWWVVCHRP